MSDKHLMFSFYNRSYTICNE